MFSFPKIKTLKLQLLFNKLYNYYFLIIIKETFINFLNYLKISKQ